LNNFSLYLIELFARMIQTKQSVIPSAQMF